MTTAVVYDRKTGKIVHMHTIADESANTGKYQKKPDDIRRLVHPPRASGQLDILHVDSAEIKPGVLYGVSLKTKKLQAKSGKPGKSGGGSLAGATRFGAK